MPYLKVQTNVEFSKDAKDQILGNLTDLISKELGKPEQFIMVVIQASQSMIFGGSFDPVIYIELRSIRLPEAHTKSLSGSISRLIMDQMNIKSDRIFINFVNVEPHMWGYNSSTFSKK